jgi:transcriptional activator SPT7
VSQNHPLRQCVKRLQAKAENLLKYITDRKDRLDPSIPSGLPSPTGVARPKINGNNGYDHSSHTRSPSYTLGSKPSTPTLSTFHRPSVPTLLRNASSDVQFQDTPALIRTGEGMVSFLNFDLQISSPNPKNGLARELRELAFVLEHEDESSDIRSPDDSAMIVDSTSGDKRKM